MLRNNASSDSQIDNYPFLHNSNKSDNSLVSSIKTEGFIILVIAFILILIFNFFNVIPLSKNYPAFFGFLPHIQSYEKDLGKTGVLPTPEKAPDLKVVPYLSCPVAATLCAKGKTITEGTGVEKSYILEFPSIPKDEFVYAPLSGTIKLGKQELIISNKERGVEVKIGWTGDMIITSDIRSGANILEKQTIGSFTNSSGSLEVSAQGLIIKEQIKLGVEKQGKFLTNPTAM